MPDYQLLTQDELLNLAQQKDQLTAEARLELESEISRRQIGAAEVSGYARETAAGERIEDRRKKRSRAFYEGRNKRFLGKSNRKVDPARRIENFDTTLWVIFWIPIFPLGSYRIRRCYQGWWNPCRSRRVHVLETGARDWNQIFATWLKTSAIILALGAGIYAARNFHS